MGDKQVIEEYLALADIKINGNRLGDIKVHNQKLYSRLLAGGSLALGESYMEGWWDCNHLDTFVYKLLNTNLDEKLISKSMVWGVLKTTA